MRIITDTDQKKIAKLLFGEPDEIRLIGMGSVEVVYSHDMSQSWSASTAWVEADIYNDLPDNFDFNSAEVEQTLQEKGIPYRRWGFWNLIAIT